MDNLNDIINKNNLSCSGVSCGNCADYIHIGGGVRKCALCIPPIRKAIDNCKVYLEKPTCDPQIAIMFLRDYSEVKDAELSDLAWAIYKDSSPHKNDVLGFIEALEKHLSQRK